MQKKIIEAKVWFFENKTKYFDWHFGVLA